MRSAALRRAERARGTPPDLGLIRFYRTPVKKPEARGRNFASRLREMARGTRRRRTPAGEEPLGNPVLERMKGDDGKPAACFQQTLGGGEAAGELVKLLVDGLPDPILFGDLRDLEEKERTTLQGRSLTLKHPVEAAHHPRRASGARRDRGKAEDRRRRRSAVQRSAHEHRVFGGRPQGRPVSEPDPPAKLVHLFASHLDSQTAVRSVGLLEPILDYAGFDSYSGKPALTTSLHRALGRRHSPIAYAAPGCARDCRPDPGHHGRDLSG